MRQLWVLILLWIGCALLYLNHPADKKEKDTYQFYRSNQRLVLGK